MFFLCVQIFCYNIILNISKILNVGKHRDLLGFEPVSLVTVIKKSLRRILHVERKDNASLVKC